MSGFGVSLRSGGHSTKKRNQVWETIIASLVAAFADDVRFAEPDVLCRYADKTFSVAAKVCYSPQNVTQNVLRGFGQSQAKADAGLVFLDVAAIYPQVGEYELSGFRNYSRQSEVLTTMRNAVDRWCRSFDIDSWMAEARKRPNNPVGVAFFLCPSLRQSTGISGQRKNA